MRDKRVDALLATLPPMECKFWKDEIDFGVCLMVKDEFYPSARTDCGGDLRKCEREDLR